MELVKDLFLTESFLVKGHVRTGGRRLSNYLNNLGRKFIEVHDATLVGVQQGDRIVTARAMISIDEILLAHELLESAGDETFKRMSDIEGDLALVNLYFGGRLPLEVSGKMRKKAYMRTDLGDQDFLIVNEPTVEGLAGKRPREFQLLKRTPYVIVNKRRIAYVFDYSA